MREIIPINATTYETTLLGGDKVEIGDRGSADFKPHIKLNRWDGECFIKVGLPITDKRTPVVEGDKVKWIEPNLEAHFYPLEPTTVIAKDKDGKDVSFTQNELGGFEFEVILKKKPAKNTITLDIETQGLNFYYQPPLTQEEVDDGCIRPNNVVGSYAVYHDTRTRFHKSKADAEKYKCSIAFHIYRPKITDAEGNWVWGELSLDEKAGTLTTTIPQDFLDSAIYPISTGTTNFGYETIGGSAAALANAIRGNSHNCPSAGVAQSISIHLTKEDNPTNCALYLRDDDSFIKATEVKDSQVGWIVFNFVAPKPDLTATTYVICAWGNGVTSCSISYNAITWDRYYKSPITGQWSWPNPFNGSMGDAKYKYSIYCTYEEEAAGWTGKISGVVNPAKIMGVDVANIAKVKGVT